MKTYLAGWGRQPVVMAEEETPSDSNGLASTLLEPYLPRGLGRSYGDASLPAIGHRSLNTARSNRLLSFNPATGVLDAEAGVTLASILAVGLPRGYFLPVTPGTRHVSLGGALASNVHGKNHHRVGSIEHFVLEMEVHTPIGIRICSREAHADLFWATLGGYGLTGCIMRAKIRLKQIDRTEVDVLRLRASNLDGLFHLFTKHDADFEYSVAWVDALARGSALGRGVILLGNHTRKPDLENSDVNRVVNTPLSHRGNLRPAKWRIPFAMPGFLLNRPSLSIFNALFYALTPRHGQVVQEDLTGFFYPLDRFEDWNLLYGKTGFFQYQCVIADPDAEVGIAACIRFLSDHRLGAFLSVLKRCGDDEVMIPFCKRGYTLALDIPNRGPQTLRLLDKLDELVIRFKGRVYLSKDARLSPESFRAMYPESKAWMETVRKYNPEARSNSRMAERLKLWSA